jgi:hypothetical protein
MAIVAVLMISLGTSLHVGFQAREKTENAVSADRSAELVMEIIRNDLESALPPGRGTFEQNFEGTTNPRGDGFDDLDFFTTAPASVHILNGVPVANGDIKEIEITAYQPAGSTDRVLVHRTWNNLLDPQYQPQYQQTNLQNADEEVLCRQVVGLTIQYYDGNGQQWMPTWDSTAATPTNSLPTAVEVTLQLQSPNKNADGSPSVVSFTRVFQLPCVGATSSTSTATTATGASSTGGTP